MWQTERAKPGHSVGAAPPSPFVKGQHSNASTTMSDDGTADRIRVCVRVRPLAPKELAAGQTTTCRAEGVNVVLDDGKQYAYDAVFGDKACDETGAQDDVWKDLSETLAPAAKQGYNVSLLAYGQTGSGKSHTMFGRKNCRGVVPRFCEALFEEGEGLSVAASMLEIYNEKLRDLLAPPVPQGDKTEPLRIREDPRTGPYASGATIVKCTTAQDLLRLVRLGARNRTIASTRMNETSSRAHTVFTVRLVRDSVVDGFNLRRSACVHLVDLAGSERQKRAGSTGARLKEAGHINRSLLTLSAVVNALTKQDGRHVPYRDSVLTHLLRDSLGGNARTTMVATVSPANDDSAETQSTLRYAERCKKVACRAVVNETELSKRDSIIRKMAEEIKFLKGELDAERNRKAPAFDTIRAQGFSQTIDDSSPGKALAQARERMESDALKRITDYEDSMSSLAEWAPPGCSALTTVAELERASFGTASRGGLGTRASSRQARLVNLNEDPQLSGALRYSLHEGASVVGTNNCAVQLGGSGITEDHALVQVTDDKVVVCRRQGDTYVNGKQVTQPVTLNHGDRVAFGRLNVFRLSLTGVDDDGEGDWDAACAELAAHASSGNSLALPWDDDEQSSRHSDSSEGPSRRPSRPTSQELSPVKEAGEASPARVSFDSYNADGVAATRLQAMERGRAARRTSGTPPVPRGASLDETAEAPAPARAPVRFSPVKAGGPLPTSPVAPHRSPPARQVLMDGLSPAGRSPTGAPFSPLEAEVAELRSRLDAIEGHRPVAEDRPPASPVAKNASPGPPRRPPPTFAVPGAQAASEPAAPVPDGAARARRSVFAKASPGTPAAKASPGAHVAKALVLAPAELRTQALADALHTAPAAPAPRPRAPPRPPLADVGQTLDPHAPRAELRASLRKLRPLAAAAAAAWGGRWTPVLEPCVADGPRASLRCLPAVAREGGRSVDQSALQWALNRDAEPTKEGRVGVAGVHLEALAKGFDVRGSVAVADRKGGNACTLAVALRARPRGGVKLGARVSIDVAMAITEGLKDVGDLRRGLVYQFFDRTPTVVVGEGPLRHACSVDVDVTPEFLAYLSAEALLVEVRLVEAAEATG